MVTKLTAHQKLIAKEISWVDTQIALCRYDLTEAILTGVPLGLCKNINAELAELIFKRYCLAVGAYTAYADNIRYNVKV